MPDLKKPSSSSSQKIAQDSYDRYLQYSGSPERADYLRDGQESHNFYMGYQWSQAEKEKLETVGLYPAIRNRIKVPADFLVSVFSSQPSRGRVTFNSGKDDTATFMINGIIKYIIYVSDYEVQSELCSRDVVYRGGLGWKMPVYDPHSSDGAGDILIQHVPKEFVYYSPTVRNLPSLSDAPDIIIARPESFHWAVRNNPGKKRQLKKAMRFFNEEIYKQNVNSQGQTANLGNVTDTSVGDGELTTVMKLERYEIVDRKQYRITSKMTGESFDTYDSTLSPVQQFKVDMGIWEVSELGTKRRCRVIHSYAPDIYIGSTWLEMDRYPMVPYLGIPTGNLFPKDMVHFAVDEQRVLNKAVSQGIQHTQSANTPKIFIDSAASPQDKKTVKDNYYQPGAIMEVAANPLTGEIPIKIIPPTSLASPFYAQVPMLERGIFDVIGVQPQEIGSMENAPETFKATALITESGKMKLRPTLNSFNASDQRLFDNVVQMIPQYYTEQRTISFFDEEWDENIQQAEINVPEYLGGKWQTVSKSIIDGEQITSGAVGDLCGRFRIIKDSFVPTERQNIQNMLLEALKLTGGNLVIFSEIIKLSDLPNRKSLAQKLDVVQQLQGKAEQLEKALRDQEITTQRAQREEVNAKQGTVLAEFKAKQMMEYIKTRSKNSEELTEFAATLDMKMTEYTAKLENDLKEHQLAMEKIEIEYKAKTKERE